MERVSAIKHTVTAPDVTELAAGTIEKCIGRGATRMRTHVEVDPKVGLHGSREGGDRPLPCSPPIAATEQIKSYGGSGNPRRHGPAIESDHIP